MRLKKITAMLATVILITNFTGVIAEASNSETGNKSNVTKVKKEDIEKQEKEKQEKKKQEREKQEKEKQENQKKEKIFSGKIVEDKTFKGYETRAAIAEKESNDTMQYANNIGVNSGNYYVGMLKREGYYEDDEDFYKFTLNSDAEVTITFSHDQIPGDGDNYFRIQLLNSGNNEYFSKYSKGYDSKKEFKIGLKKGTYYIKISEGGYFEPNIKYRLAVNSKNGEFEKESNDTMGEATLLNNGKEMKGRLNHSSDYDYYKLTIPKDGEVSINLKKREIPGDSTTYHKVSLLDSKAKGWQWYITGSDNGLQTKMGLKKGTYYIKVESNYYYSDDEYGISYKFKENANYETEENDSQATANLMKINTTKRGNIHSRYGVDNFKINLKYTGQYKLNFTNPRDERGMVWNVDIRNSKGNVLEEMHIDGKSQSHTKQIDLAAGTYYIRVEDYNYNNPGEYGVTLYEQNDWNKHWASGSIQEAMNRGWVNKADIFRPDDSITRAEFIKIVNRTFGFNSMATSEPFVDVSNNSWYRDDVRKAIKAGYISVKNKKFRPEDPISREEVASIITSIKKNRDTNLDKIKKYKDYKQISDWARTSVEGAVEKGYMGKGSDMFRPKHNITRAEAVVTLGRVK